MLKEKGRLLAGSLEAADAGLDVLVNKNRVRSLSSGRVRTSGDAAATMAADGSSTSDVDGTVLIYNAAITADRAVALTVAGAVAGMKWTVVRNASATGAFNVNVGTGPLKALAAASTWCEVTFDGTAWVLTGAGSL